MTSTMAHTPATTAAARGWQWRLALLALIWGSSFLLIKLSLPAYGAYAIATIRMWIGAASLLVVLAVSGDRLPRAPRAWLHAAVAGVCANAIPFTLVGIGVSHATSILGAIWNATTPLIVLVLAVVVLREEQATPRVLGGTLLGFIGVVVLLGIWRGGMAGADGIGIASLAGAALCYGASTPYMRRTLARRPESTTSLAAAQLACASVALLVAWPFVPEAIRHVAPSAHATAALAVLGVGATGVAYLLFTWLVRGAGASTAASVTYLMPLVASVLGVVVLGEQPRWNEPLGCIVILVGVAIASRARARREHVG